MRLDLDRLAEHLSLPRKYVRDNVVKRDGVLRQGWRMQLPHLSAVRVVCSPWQPAEPRGRRRGLVCAKYAPTHCPANRNPLNER